MKQRPPEMGVTFCDLPADPGERHEALVAVFGRYVMLVRNRAVQATHDLVESQEAREALGNLQRRPYDDVAGMSPDGQHSACKLAEATVDQFIRLFLYTLGGTGTDLRLDEAHAIRFKLVMEILSVERAEVIDEETINRGGEKFFGDYWGRWLNRS